MPAFNHRLEPSTRLGLPKQAVLPLVCVMMCFVVVILPIIPLVIKIMAGVLALLPAWILFYYIRNHDRLMILPIIRQSKQEGLRRSRWEC
jgi:hypothetical protein